MGEVQKGEELKPTKDLEHESQTNNASEDEIAITSVRTDNCKFRTVVIGGQSYKALLDPGATVSLVNCQIADRFQDRLADCNAFVSTVTGKVSRV